jgi:hypothetical protein
MPDDRRIQDLTSSRGLRIAYWASVLIAVAAVARRLAVLSSTPSVARPGLGGLDAAFAAHAALTLAHILPALAFVLLTPFVFRASARGWPERLLFPLGAVVGLTAYAMTGNAFGGWTERSAVLFFNSIFLVSLFRAYRCESRGDQRRWLLRAIGILLGIATTRPVMGLFFATRAFTHLEPRQFFGIAFWIGFSVNAVAVEWWLALPERAAQSRQAVSNSGRITPLAS